MSCSYEEIFEKARDILSGHLGVGAQDITEETSFKDLNLDSLDLVELMMGLEEELGVTLEPDEGVQTVGDLVRYAEKAMEQGE